MQSIKRISRLYPSKLPDTMDFSAEGEDIVTISGDDSENSDMIDFGNGGAIEEQEEINSEADIQLDLELQEICTAWHEFFRVKTALLENFGQLDNAFESDQGASADETAGWGDRVQQMTARETHAHVSGTPTRPREGHNASHTPTKPLALTRPHLLTTDNSHTVK
ncbi:uncharacterized protein LOC128629542 isoform X2 [Ictalurus punctatus]|uniref:Uncharacterized protein LOC128629542 isoform X2 n=1 Tax=Ictalurus punctatus TaxID=7998 RepID=A0A9F7TID5_ICTPU|nr:uncharacterized protein LOC128629542 isoform X2 [Ictalurus punctatus]